MPWPPSLVPAWIPGLGLGFDDGWVWSNPAWESAASTARCACRSPSPGARSCREGACSLAAFAASEDTGDGDVVPEHCAALLRAAAAFSSANVTWSRGHKSECLVNVGRFIGRQNVLAYQPVPKTTQHTCCFSDFWVASAWASAACMSDIASSRPFRICVARGVFEGRVSPLQGPRTL